MSVNTLRQVMMKDLYVLKGSINVMVDFYVRHCEEISDLANTFGESEEDTVEMILKLGIQEYKKIADILSKEGKS